MWDRLLVDCNIMTMEPAAGDPLGVVRNGAIGIENGRILRVGKRTDLAGFRAKEVVALGGAWVTPGLIDCHTHLVFGGTRAGEHAMRRAGASYEDIARAGGGIASTVAATKAASDGELLEQSRRRLKALMAGGCTTVEIKSGYGFDTASELRLLETAKALGEQEAVRIVPTLLALHALPAGADREAFIKEVTDRLIPEAARKKLATAQLVMNMACTLFGLTPEEAIAGMTINAARALGLAHEVGSIAANKAADLAVWRIADPAELGYWAGLMPERRIFGGLDS
jgi:imidazolonepropionase